MERVDLVGELLAALSQIRQRRVPGGPLLLPRGLSGPQFLLPVTQLCGALILPAIDGLNPLAADCVDLLVQVTGVRPGTHPLLNGYQPPLGLLQPTLHPRRQAELPLGRSGRHRLLAPGVRAPAG